MHYDNIQKRVNSLNVIVTLEINDQCWLLAVQLMKFYLNLNNMYNNDTRKRTLPVWNYLSIKLHSFVCYSPRDVHRIADKLINALMLIFTFLNFLKPISFLSIVFFIQIFFCKTLFHVSCVFANKIEHGITTIIFKFYYKKIMFLSIKLISFYQKH